MSQPSKKKQQTPDAVENLDKNIGIIKRSFEAEVVRIKRDLSLWIEQNHPGPSGALKIALLELAIERQLGVCIHAPPPLINRKQCFQFLPLLVVQPKWVFHRRLLCWKQRITNSLIIH